jgi:glycosyltransferase involved in cell wall biosynthesis
VSEIVIDGKTGIIANTIDDIYKRFGEIELINRTDCRKYAENNFSSELMADNYLNVFSQYLKKHGKVK